MVKAIKKSTKTKGQKARGAIVRRRSNPPMSQEAKLLRLVTDPCGAELVHGYATTTEGVVQRFNRFITPTVTTENNFAFIFNPASQSSSSFAAGITQKTSTGTGVPTTTASGGPGDTFLNAQADSVGTLAACMEVLYTGKLVDRQGYIGVCQMPYHVAQDIILGTTDLPTLLAYCQHVTPVPSHSVEVKWSPSIRAFTGQLGNSETDGSGDNCLMVVAIGVNPTQFVVKFTSVVEYAPKFALGLPAPRATKSIPVGAGERIVTALDRMGTWWHNVGNAAAAAYRMGGSMVYAANQASRFVRGAQVTLGPATTLLALAG